VNSRPQPVVRVLDCVGCRLCHNVCPVDHCIEMVEVTPERTSITWGEIVRNEPIATQDWDAMQSYRKRNGIHIH